MGGDAAVDAADTFQSKGFLAIVAHHKAVLDEALLGFDEAEVMNVLGYIQFCLFLGR